MSILHRGKMCHRFPPVPLSLGAAMPSAGRGPFCGRPFICLGRAVFGLPVHIGIHAYTYICIHPRIEAPPACLKALVAPQRRRRSALRPLAPPPRAAASSVSGPRKVRAGPGVPALRAQGAPERTHQASCCPRQPLAGMLSGGHLLPRLAPAPPGVAALGRACGATPAPSYALASPSRLRHGRTPATSCLPRGTFADPSRDPRGPGTPRRNRNPGGQQLADSGVVWA